MRNPRGRFDVYHNNGVNPVITGRITRLALDIWPEGVGDGLVAVGTVDNYIGNISYLPGTICKITADPWCIVNNKVIHHLSSRYHQ